MLYTENQNADRSGGRHSKLSSYFPRIEIIADQQPLSMVGNRYTGSFTRTQSRRQACCKDCFFVAQCEY